MPPRSVTDPLMPYAEAAIGEAMMLRCAWRTGKINVVFAPLEDVDGYDFLEDPDQTMGFCRLPDVLAWSSLDQFVRNVVLPLTSCVRTGYRRTHAGSTFNLDAQAAKGMIARAVATWRDGEEGPA